MNTICTIFQNKNSKKITNFIIQTKDSFQLSPIYQDSFVDCDEDSYLVSGDDPPLLFQEPIDILDTTSGLIPVITVDESDLVLMQAFTNLYCLQLTIETKFAHYFSRSRDKIWKKGEESGHLQKIITVKYNKQTNCLLYKVQQTDAACHTGNYTCFYRRTKMV